MELRTIFLLAEYYLVLSWCLSASGASRMKKRRSKHKLTSNDLSFTDAYLHPDYYKKPEPPVDPRETWLNFVAHSDENSQRRGAKKRDDRKLGRLSRNEKQRGLPGPQGPPGEQGPRGPPGAEISGEALMRQFHEMVEAETERRVEDYLKTLDNRIQRCTACPNQPDDVISSNSVAAGLSSGNGVNLTSGQAPPTEHANPTDVAPHSSSDNLYSMADNDGTIHVSAGFHQRLKDNVNLPKKTFLELNIYHRPFGGGAFHRGEVFDAEQGRFIAPHDAIYSFYASVRVMHKIKRGNGNERKSPIKGNIGVKICIQSHCQKHTSLEHITSFVESNRMFSVSVSGLLYLEAGQHTSIFVDNASNVHVTILEGSSFSGILVGL